jgi:hypothetical protein
VRTLPKEAVETMIRDGVYFPPAGRVGIGAAGISKQSLPARGASGSALGEAATSPNEAPSAEAGENKRKQSSKQSSPRRKSSAAAKAPPAAISGKRKGKNGAAAAKSQKQGRVAGSAGTKAKGGTESRRARPDAA